MGHLTQAQRYEIAVLKSENFTQSKIAMKLGRHRSVISRELKRNKDDRNDVYKAELAQKKCEKRLKKKPKKIHFTPAVEATVIGFLEQDYSPVQIVGRAKIEGLSCVSAERIYQFIWKDKKAGGSHYEHLRTQGKKYAKRGNTNGKRGQIVGRVDIDERPKVVDEKQRLGDLEMDLVIGAGQSGAILTINDRVTGMLKMAKIESKEAHIIETKSIELLQEWMPFLNTITTDNGKEFANHKNIANALQIDFYFAKPYHSWQRGANENLNGLIRQYFPKKHDFKLITNEQITQIQNKLNNRPRKRFGFLSPNEIFSLKLEMLHLSLESTRY